MFAVLLDAHLGGRLPERAIWGFPHRTWKAVGTWCGQVGSSVAVQAFPDVVIFCPRPRLFSTRYVESDGNLMWTSGCEHCSAGVSKRGENLSRSRGRAPCRAEPTLGSGWHQPSMGSALHQVRRFSTPGVESDGSLLWTSAGERHAASVSQRGDFLSIARNANAPHKAGRPGSIRCRWIRR